MLTLLRECPGVLLSGGRPVNRRLINPNGKRNPADIASSRLRRLPASCRSGVEGNMRKIAIGRDIRHDAHVDEHKYDAGQMRSIARKKVCGSRSTSWACPAYGSARMTPTTRTPRQQSRQMTTGSALAGGPLPSDSKKPRALDCPDGVHRRSIV